MTAPRPSELERLKRRDSVAWSHLFETHHPLVYRAVLAQVGNRAVAEDIAGQVFLEALQGIGRYRDRGKPITAWLLAIARHRTLDWLRKQRRIQQVPLSEEGSVMADNGVTRAIEALQFLTPAQREVISLRFVEGYPLEAVAHLTNRPIGAVKSLQHRALESLRHLLLRMNEEEVNDPI